MSVYRAVVRHTCARRLQFHRKCNRRGEIRGSHNGERYSSFELVTFALSTPSRGGGVLRVMLPNAEFGLYLYWV